MTRLCPYKLSSPRHQIVTWLNNVTLIKEHKSTYLKNFLIMNYHPVLVTGVAGFIGFHTASRLLQSGRSVIGVDNLNDYYDPTLKQARLNELSKFSEFTFLKVDIADKNAMEKLLLK